MSGAIHLPKVIFVSACILSLLFSSLFSGVTAADPANKYYFGQTSDLEPVTLNIKNGDRDIRFFIPKTFLDYSANWQSGEQDFISMSVIYPEMTSKVLAHRNSNDPSVIGVKLYSSRGGIKFNVSNELSKNLKKEWLFIKPLNDEFDLYVSRSEVQQWREARVVREFVVPRNQGAVYFQCISGQQTNNNTGCIGYRNFEDSVFMQIIIRRNRLAEWRNIFDAVDAMLKNFQVNTRSPS